MMFNFGHSSFARVFGIEVYGDHYEKWYWHIFIWPIYRAGRAIRDAIWWVRYRIDPRHRYNVIHTGLKPNYYDIDHIMLHGMLSLLRRYVEEEHEGVDELEAWGRELLAEEKDFLKSVNIEQGKKELEAVALYRWWTESYPSMQARKDELMDMLYGGEDRVTWTDEVIDGEAVSEMHVRPDIGEEIAWKKELDGLEERIDREEQEMLHRLIDIRRRLWT